MSDSEQKHTFAAIAAVVFGPVIGALFVKYTAAGAGMDIPPHARSGPKGVQSP